MHSDEIVIYEPLENSNLISIIPSTDKILYSAIFEVFNRLKSYDKWSSHVILTDKGVAISNSVLIPIPNGCGVKSGDLYYFPWHAVHKAIGYSARLAIGDFFLRLEPIKDLEAIKPIEIMDKELMERSEILIKQNKDALYENLLPFFKSWPKPKHFLPSSNTSRFPMLNEVYTKLRSRYLKEVRKGKIKPRSKIWLDPKLINYSGERILEEFKNYNIEPGSYDERMKIEEMIVAFTNFFVKHSIEEAVDLVLEMFEINPLIAGMWFSKVRSRVAFPRLVGSMISNIEVLKAKEKDFYEFDNIINEKLFFPLAFKDDEYVIVDFKGKVNLPNAHLEYPGHVYLTNYQLIVPNIPLIKGMSPPTISYTTGIITSGIRLIGGVIKAGVKAHIEGARKVLANVIKQNPDMFYIKNPYNIQLHEKLKGTTYNIKFAMDFNYRHELSQKSKKYKLVITIKINKLKHASSRDYKQKRIDVVSKFADFLSCLPNRV